MEVTTISLSKIKRSDKQPRKYFDEKAIKELSESIKKDGLMQPITVRKVSHDTFEIVQGERRYRACKLAGLTEIPAHILSLSDEEAFHLAVIENIQRENMTPIEEAQAFQKYVEMGYKHKEIAEKISKGRTYVTQRLRLLKLSTEIQDMIAEKRISEGHVKQLFKYQNMITKHIRRKKPNKVFQDLFYINFKDRDKITVKDVEAWGELMRYHFIMAIIATYNGKVNVKLWNEYRTVKSFCEDYHLHIETISKEDINFLCEWTINETGEGVKKSEIYRVFEDLEEHLFNSNTDVHSIWEKRNVQYIGERTLDELTELIKNNLKILEDAKTEMVRVYKGAASNLKGDQKEILLEEAERIEGMSAVDYTVELMNKDIEKVSRDTNMSWEELRQ